MTLKIALFYSIFISRFFSVGRPSELHPSAGSSVQRDAGAELLHAGKRRIHSLLERRCGQLHLRNPAEPTHARPEPDAPIPVSYSARKRCQGLVLINVFCCCCSFTTAISLPPDQCTSPVRWGACADGQRDLLGGNSIQRGPTLNHPDSVARTFFVDVGRSSIVAYRLRFPVNRGDTAVKRKFSFFFGSLFLTFSFLSGFVR